MANYYESEEPKVPTEYESEREQMATVMDIILEVRKAMAEGKKEYTCEELIEFLYEFISDKKRHK